MIATIHDLCLIVLGYEVEYRVNRLTNTIQNISEKRLTIFRLCKIICYTNRILKYTNKTEHVLYTRAHAYYTLAKKLKLLRFSNICKALRDIKILTSSKPHNTKYLLFHAEILILRTDFYKSKWMNLIKRSKYLNDEVIEVEKSIITILDDILHIDNHNDDALRMKKQLLKRVKK